MQWKVSKQIHKVNFELPYTSTHTHARTHTNMDLSTEMRTWLHTHKHIRTTHTCPQKCKHDCTTHTHTLKIKHWSKPCYAYILLYLQRNTFYTSLIFAYQDKIPTDDPNSIGSGPQILSNFYFWGNTSIFIYWKLWQFYVSLFSIATSFASYQWEPSLSALTFWICTIKETLYIFSLSANKKSRQIKINFHSLQVFPPTCIYTSCYM